MTARRLLLLALGLAASGCPSAATSRPGPSSVVVGATGPRREVAPPRSRQCRVDTIHGEGPTETQTSAELFLVDTDDVLTELRLTSGGSSIVVQREYDATKRLVSESHRTKDKDIDRHVTIAWHRGGDGHVESVDRVVEERAAAGTSTLRKELVTFPQRDASGHWLRKDGQNVGAPVTRTDTREYDSAGRLAVEMSRWSETAERPAKSAESRFTYEGSSRTAAYEEGTTADAAGQVTERVYRRFDASGRLSSELVRPTTGREVLRGVKYDEAGRIVEELSSVEVTHRSSYRGDCPSNLKLFEVTGADAGEG